MTIRIAGLVDDSVVDGPGLRYVIFTQGCHHYCLECHNPNTHDINGGKIEEIDNIINYIKKNPLLDGITISGGEPFLQKKACLEIVQAAQKLGLDVLIYTGYTYEALLDLNDETVNNILKSADYLIDGRFLKEKKSLALKFIGSSNQRIIDLKKSSMDMIVETDFSNYVLK